MVAGEIGAGTHRGDAAVPDGDGAVVDGSECVVHGDDGGAADENVRRVAGAHFDDSDQVAGRREASRASPQRARRNVATDSTVKRVTNAMVGHTVPS